LWHYLPGCFCTQCSFSTSHFTSKRMHENLAQPMLADVLFHVQGEDGDSSNRSVHNNLYCITHSRNGLWRYCECLCQLVPTGTDLRHRGLRRDNKRR
jgi:hypothetical protein